MSDLVENQVQLLLAGQALENDIFNVHTLASDTTGMSDIFVLCSRFYNILIRCRTFFFLSKRENFNIANVYCRCKIRSTNSTYSHLLENSNIHSCRCCHK